MTVQVKWDNPEHTVLLWEFVGEWTWDELLAAHAEGSALMNQVHHTVDSIVDMSGSKIVPPNLFSMYKTLRERLSLPSNQGITLVVGASPFLRTLIYTYSKISNFFSDDFSLAGNLHEARAILRYDADSRV